MGVLDKYERNSEIKQLTAQVAELSKIQSEPVEKETEKTPAPIIRDISADGPKWVTKSEKDSRARGYDPGFSTWKVGQDFTGQRAGDVPSWEQLYQLYKRVALIKAIIDGISRVISNLEYKIIPRDPDKPVAGRRLRIVQSFFDTPNYNDEPFSRIVFKVVKDLLRYDAGAIEKSFSSDNILTEIFARDGSTIIPITDQHGTVEEYKQKIVRDNKEVTFETDQLIYMMLSPDTKSKWGSPPMDALIKELTSEINAMDYIVKTFNKDQIPQGLLDVGTTDRKYVERLRQYFEALAPGNAKDFILPIIYNFEKVDWTKLERDPKEMQMLDILNRLDKRVMAVFGVSSIEFNAEQDINRATALVERDASQSNLIKPLKDTLEDYYNRNIVWPHFFPDVMFEYAIPDTLTPELVIQRADKLAGRVLTVNESRVELGKKPVPGGDVLTGVNTPEPNPKPVQPEDVEEEDQNLQEQLGLIEEQKRVLKSLGNRTAKRLAKQLLKGKNVNNDVRKSNQIMFGVLKGIFTDQELTFTVEDVNKVVDLVHKNIKQALSIIKSDNIQDRSEMETLLRATHDIDWSS